MHGLFTAIGIRERMQRGGVVAIMAGMLFCPPSAWSMHPLTMKDTATEGVGNMLLELKFDQSFDNDARSASSTAAFTLGLGKHIDLGLDVPYIKLAPNPAGIYSSGVGDSTFRFKQRLFENEVKQSMAYEFHIKFPTGDIEKGTGTNNIYWGFKIIDSQECRNNVFHVNLGYETRLRDTKDWHYVDNYSFTFGFAIEHEIARTFRIVGEVTGGMNAITDDGTGVMRYARPLTGLLGFVYDFSKAWYVDAGYRGGLNSDAMDYMIQIGTAWRF